MIERTVRSSRFQFVLFALAIALGASLSSGCASFGKKFKAFLNGGEVDDPAVPKISTPRFSETDSVRYGVERKYRRMNRDRFEDEADVAAGAGSLWVMEGQGAYLFAQNRMRLVGDILTVRVEGAPKSQLQTKTRVIAKLLERLEKPDSAPALRGPASAKPPVGDQPPAGASVAGAQSQAGQPQAAGVPSPPSGQPAPSRPDAPFNVQTVPTRIVEVLRDGSYRVKGSQDFMIGKREYRVIVTGIVRPEDFNDEGIDAEKLLDPQFDIVSAKRGVAL